jgi:dipeptidyl aminopeptidase/acylaminoacyl peptidase
VRDSQNHPIQGAWVLVAHRSGTTYSARTDQAGHYQIGNIPPGRYRPVAGAPEFADARVGNLWQQTTIAADKASTVDAVLPPAPRRQVAAGTEFRLSEPTTISCSRPFESQAAQYEVSFNNAGVPNQPTFYYTPTSITIPKSLPVLFIVYPGPPDTWSCASVPLADAGYAVLATGPAYSFDLQSDVDELERLLNFVRQGNFPASNQKLIALLGGSYSALHVQHLLRRGQDDVAAALLLGPPTDLFEMRRLLENGTYIPPFGLDQALIALGLPDQEPLRYWSNSGAYHVEPDFPPLAVLHSRSDEVVPYQQSELLARQLEIVGVPHEVHFFDGASHYLLAEDSDEDTLMIYDITLTFLATHLKARDGSQD